MLHSRRFRLLLCGSRIRRWYGSRSGLNLCCFRNLGWDLALLGLIYLGYFAVSNHFGWGCRNLLDWFGLSFLLHLRLLCCATNFIALSSHLLILCWLSSALGNTHGVLCHSSLGLCDIFRLNGHLFINLSGLSFRRSEFCQLFILMTCLKVLLFIFFSDIHFYIFASNLCLLLSLLWNGSRLGLGSLRLIIRWVHHNRSAAWPPDGTLVIRWWDPHGIVNLGIDLLFVLFLSICDRWFRLTCSVWWLCT